MRVSQLGERTPCARWCSSQAEREPDRPRAMLGAPATCTSAGYRESLRQDARSAVEWLYHLSHVDELSALEAL